MSHTKGSHGITGTLAIEFVAATCKKTSTTLDTTQVILRLSPFGVQSADPFAFGFRTTQLIRAISAVLPSVTEATFADTPTFSMAHGLMRRARVTITGVVRGKGQGIYLGRAFAILGVMCIKVTFGHILIDCFSRFNFDTLAQRIFLQKGANGLPAGKGTQRVTRRGYAKGILPDGGWQREQGIAD